MVRDLMMVTVKTISQQKYSKSRASHGKENSSRMISTGQREQITGHSTATGRPGA
jgi:hypothetical protein